jgi:hypothetical protein
MMLHQYKDALEDARKAVALDSSYVKVCMFYCPPPPPPPKFNAGCSWYGYFKDYFSNHVFNRIQFIILCVCNTHAHMGVCVCVHVHARAHVWWMNMYLQ